MSEAKKKDSRALTEHFFRNEYGKIVSVITKYVGTENVETAEDIVQETLLKAVDFWQHNGIPENPQAWLYTTAKNITLNILKRKKHLVKFKEETKNTSLISIELENLEISEELIVDEQLKMMFVCCHPSISENSQIALILKILCGFSISEIANAFFSTNETINKRLVRGRGQLRKNSTNDYLDKMPNDVNKNLAIVLKTIYLLFNEGYSPSKKHQLIRYDLCLEAIRLTKILVDSKYIKVKADCYALLALMYLNASRFEARTNTANAVIEMEKQDRNNWDQDLINKGIYCLNQAVSEKNVTVYLILATISANHCIAPSFEETNWKEILSLYDKLILLEDSPIARLNRIVVLSKVAGNKEAILALQHLESDTDIGNHYLFHSTLAELYKKEGKTNKVVKHLQKAISLTQNERDSEFLNKKLIAIVPN